MESGVYQIKNKVNGKSYIGSSINIKNRLYKHLWMLRNNRHDNIYLQSSYNKYGEDSFEFNVLENCEEPNLIITENKYIELLDTLKMNNGYNLALTNKFRRNSFINEVKIKNSKFNLKSNNNFLLYSLTNILTNEEYIFDNLVEGANYLINNGFTKGKPSYVRMKLSNSLRGKKVNNGHKGSIRKTCYKHEFKIIK